MYVAKAGNMCCEHGSQFERALVWATRAPNPESDVVARENKCWVGIHQTCDSERSRCLVGGETQGLQCMAMPQRLAGGGSAGSEQLPTHSFRELPGPRCMSDITGRHQYNCRDCHGQGSNCELFLSNCHISFDGEGVDV